jgi:hypothetical protein
LKSFNSMKSSLGEGLLDLISLIMGRRPDDMHILATNYYESQGH